ncbi:MAG TPA: L,D-transpeptidase [Actinomycetota bacterium]|nr:L,D-transpeptidase [Actinomycetota bacterium]
MLRRLVVLLFMSLGVVFLASAAEAAGQDSFDQRRAEVAARIACHRQVIRGGPACSGDANRATASSKVSNAQAAPVAAAQAAPRAQAAGGPKRIVISTQTQTLKAYEGDRVVMDTPVSTGAPGFPTPTGTYSIQSKEKMHWSTQYGVWMPYAMRVVRGIFIHEVPIDTQGRRLGGALGQAASHGCIRVGVGPAQSLYEWAEVGTPVTIT